MLAARGVEVVVDDLGRPAVAREVLAQLLAERREREARLAEERRRTVEEADRKSRPTPRGVRPPPGAEHADGYSVMVGADRDSQYRIGLPPARGELTQPRRRK